MTSDRLAVKMRHMDAADVKDFYEEFGRRVRAARDGSGVTQAQLAEAIGLTRSSVANLEAGRQKIMLHVLVGIAAVLDVDPLELLPTLEQQQGLDLSKLDVEASKQQPSDREFVLNAVRTGFSQSADHDAA